MPGAAPMFRGFSLLLALVWCFCVFSGCAQERGFRQESQVVESAPILVCFQPSLAFFSRELLVGTPVMVELAGSSPASMAELGTVYYLQFSKETQDNSGEAWLKKLRDNPEAGVLVEAGLPLEMLLESSRAKEFVGLLADRLGSTFPEYSSTIQSNGTLIQAGLEKQWRATRVGNLSPELLNRIELGVDREAAAEFLRSAGFPNVSVVASPEQMPEATGKLRVYVQSGVTALSEASLQYLIEQNVRLVRFNGDDRVYGSLQELFAEHERLCELVQITALSASQ